MSIDTLNNGDSGLTARNIINSLVDSTNNGVDYKFAKLPTSYYPQYIAGEVGETIGKLYDLGPLPLGSSRPIIYLENGNLAEVAYCQSILPDGTHIYECYDYQSEDSITGYWVAFRLNPLDTTQFEKIAQLQMTQQFWDNWYSFTSKDPSIKNEVKLIEFTFPNADDTLIQSHITTLTLTDSILTATDTYFDFNGNTTLSLFNELSELTEISGDWGSWYPETILDDDYYGLMFGSQTGWIYFKNNSLLSPLQYLCSYNILTGETRIIDVVNSLTLVTNLNSLYPIGIDNFGKDSWSHSRGLLFDIQNFQLTDNGDNVNGVTSIWSPYWINNDKVVFLNNRKSDTGEFASIEGAIGGNTGQKSYYWDNNNFYIIDRVTVSSFFFIQIGSAISFCRFPLDSSELQELVHIPFNPPNNDVIELYLENLSLSLWSNNDGLLLTISNLFLGGGGEPFGLFNFYYYWKSGEKNPYILQNNNMYPTNILENKIYSHNSLLSVNWLILQTEYDVYPNINFNL
jgi:hypothetical protein